MTTPGRAHIRWLRDTAPYFNAHRGKTFVLMLGGEIALHENFAPIFHDIALLNSLGVRLVLVHGSRPQIALRLERAGLETSFHDGMRITDTRSGKKLFYAPGLAEVETHVKPFMEEADCLLVDGTTWTNDDMARLGIANKMALDMGHMPQSGPGGMIETLRPLKAERKILIHINNTNPILREDSDERRQLEAENIEISFDGMDIRI